MHIYIHLELGNAVEFTGWRALDDRRAIADERTEPSHVRRAPSPRLRLPRRARRQSPSATLTRSGRVALRSRPQVCRSSGAHSHECPHWSAGGVELVATDSIFRAN